MTLGTYNFPPGGYTQGTQGYQGNFQQQQPGNFPPGNYQQPPGGYQQPPGNYQQPPGGYQPPRNW